MIQRLNIHDASVRLENLSGTSTACMLEDTTRSILEHVSHASALMRIDKCSLIFRVSTEAPLPVAYSTMSAAARR